MDEAFWRAAECLAEESELVIDRPKGSAHPRYPNLRYPLDYGYLRGTASMDGGGIDVWLGSDPSRRLTGLLCTVDLLKRDSEIKLCLGCTEEELRLALQQLNSGSMRALLLRRPDGP